MAEQLTDKEEFSKRISDKRRSRSDTKKGEVGAAWVKQPPKTKKPKDPRAIPPPRRATHPIGDPKTWGKAKPSHPVGDPSMIDPSRPPRYGTTRTAWAAMSRAERDRIRSRAGVRVGKALSAHLRALGKGDKNSKSLTK